MSLESKNYVASPTDIENLTRSVLEAARTGVEGRASYLRALIATTQARLKSGPRLRQTGISKLSPTERDKQIEKLEEVDAEFYTLVKKAAYEALKEQGRYSAIEHNRRCNFARSSRSVVRTWIKAGNDITSLVAGKTTKGMLALAPRQGKPPSTRVLTNQVQRITDMLKPVAIALYVADDAAGRAELDKLKDWIDEMVHTERKHKLRHQREQRVTN